MPTTNETGEVILIKSEKASQKKKKIIVWVIAIIAIAATIVPFVIDYGGYRKGQEYGLAVEIATAEQAGLHWVDKDDSYAERCRKVYKELRSDTDDIYVNGMRLDASGVRATENEMRRAFSKAMKSAGFDRYYREWDEWKALEWFKYANAAEYYIGNYWDKPIPIISYVLVFFAITYTILINIEAKKELIVYEDSVLCKYNPKKSKQLIFADINNVDFGKNSLRLVGAGVKYKISNLTNAEELKAVIIDKKKATQKATNDTSASVSASNADELKKYKDLLDAGVISQEEFEAKKKQILGT